MAYNQKPSMFSFKKATSSSPLKKQQFPIGPKTKLRSYEGLLNKKTGAFAGAGTKEAEQMYAEAKRTGDYSILEGLVDTSKLGLKSNLDNINRPNFSVSPQVRNAISGRGENYGQDVETGAFNPGTPRQNEKAGQFSNDLAEMIMGYNVQNTPENNRMNYGYDKNGNQIAPNVDNVSIPFDQGIATTSNGEAIYTTARPGVGLDENFNTGGNFVKRRDKDGNTSLASRSIRGNQGNDVTRLLQQNNNFNRRLNSTGAFTLSDFRDELQNNPNAFYATPAEENSYGIYDRGQRNPGNRASLPNIRDNYMNYDTTGEQQRPLKSWPTTGGYYGQPRKAVDVLNTGQSPRAEVNFTKYLENQARYQGEPLDRGTNYLQYRSYENNRDVQGKNESYRVR
jgi:hypothetical protein